MPRVPTAGTYAQPTNTIAIKDKTITDPHEILEPLAATMSKGEPPPLLASASICCSCGDMLAQFSGFSIVGPIVLVADDRVVVDELGMLVSVVVEVAVDD